MTGEQSVELTQYLKELRLPAIRDCYQDMAQQAREEALSYEQFLFGLVETEREARRQNRVARLLRESRLPLEKSLHSFDRKRLPRKVDAHLGLLLDGTFLDRTENVLAFGNPGNGKTHLLCGIGQALIYLGRRVLFTPCNLLVQDLLIAKRDLNLARLLKKLRKYEALITLALRLREAQVHVSTTSATSSTAGRKWRYCSHCWRIATNAAVSCSPACPGQGNLPFSHWERIFNDPMTTAAAIDRLVHHSIILELNLPSYRLEQSKRRSEDEVA